MEVLAPRNSIDTPHAFEGAVNQLNVNAANE